MSTPKTPTEIAQEIHDLKALRGKVRLESMFGDNNQDAIDAQLSVLQHGWGNEAVWERWPSDEGDHPHLRDAAREAVSWRDGESDEGLADGWKSLVVDDASA